MRVRYIIVGIALIVVIAAPILLTRNIQNVLVFACVYAIASLGVALLLRTCGIVNAGQALFYAIGAYSSANLSIAIWASPGLWDCSWDSLSPECWLSQSAGRFSA